MAKKDMKFNIKAEDVMYTSIHKSSNYNSASIGIKRGDNEYMSISYEWSGDGIPDFVMDLMSFMQANKEEIAAAVESHEEEVAKKGKMPPWLNKDKDEEEDPKKDKKGKKDKKDKEKKKKSKK